MAVRSLLPFSTRHLSDLRGFRNTEEIGSHFPALPLAKGELEGVLPGLTAQSRPEPPSIPPWQGGKPEGDTSEREIPCAPFPQFRPAASRRADRSSVRTTGASSASGRPSRYSSSGAIASPGRSVWTQTRPRSRRSSTSSRTSAASRRTTGKAAWKSRSRRWIALRLRSRRADDLRRGAGFELVLVKGTRCPHHLLDPAPAAVSVQKDPLVEGIDEEGLCARSGAQEEMARQVDPIELQPDTLGHGAVDHAQTDRYPRATVEDLVDVAVPRVVILLRVAPKTLFDEEDPVDLSEHVTGRRRPCAMFPHPLGQKIELPQRGVGIKIGIGVARDLEGDPEQVGREVARQQACKLRTVGKGPGHAGFPFTHRVGMTAVSPGSRSATGVLEKSRYRKDTGSILGLRAEAVLGATGSALGTRVCRPWTRVPRAEPVAPSLSSKTSRYRCYSLCFSTLEGSQRERPRSARRPLPDRFLLSFLSGGGAAPTNG